MAQPLDLDQMAKLLLIMRATSIELAGFAEREDIPPDVAEALMWRRASIDAWLRANRLDAGSIPR